MAKLAILGHETRGMEVIKLLEMFGAKHGNCCGGNYPHRIYYINEYNLIEACDRMHHLDYLQLTLEEFLEKFPFKVGDKVLINEDENDVYTVKSMVWYDAFNRVAYRIEAVDGIMHDNAWFAHEMVVFNHSRKKNMN